MARADRSNGSRWVSRGSQVWERVVAPNRNVVAVLSGHFHGLGKIVTEDAGGLPGHTVVELLADYQEFRSHTGERAKGFQRLLQFDLAGGSISVDTISVDTISSNLDAHASHPYDYEPFLPDNGTRRAVEPPAVADPGRRAAASLSGRGRRLPRACGVQYEKALTAEAITFG